MTELENEINEILEETMQNVNTENKENHGIIIKKLEESMMNALGDIEESHIYGLKEVANGSINIDKAKNLFNPQFSEFIDATEHNPDRDLPQALVGVMHFGSGNDIYEPLMDTPTQIRMAEMSDGLVIRCPMQATEINSDGTRLDGIITVLISDGHISACARLFSKDETVVTTWALEEYKLGKNKLTDAVYLAYTVPVFLKKHAKGLYQSLVAFNDYRDGKENEGEE